LGKISYNSLNINKIGHYFPVGLSRLLCILRPVGTNQNYIRRGRNLLIPDADVGQTFRFAFLGQMQGYSALAGGKALPEGLQVRPGDTSGENLEARISPRVLTHTFCYREGTW
jgi:hypothetical protein